MLQHEASSFSGSLLAIGLPENYAVVFACAASVIKWPDEKMKSDMEPDNG